MKKNPLIYNATLAVLPRFAIIMTAVTLLGCSSDPSNAQPSLTPMPIKDETDLKKIVSDYVRHTRDWPENSYTVQFNNIDGKMLVFWVLYKGDNTRIPGGGGKSFEVLLNSDTNHVKKELHFQ